MKYKIKDLTSKSFRCAPFGGCPRIYEIEEITPDNEKCPGALCPAIYEGIENDYLVCGKRIENPADFGLEKKVGEDEALISVPKGIIDKMKIPEDSCSEKKLDKEGHWTIIPGLHFIR